MASTKGKPAGARDIAPKIRGYFIVALDRMAKNREPLDKLIEKGLKEDLKGTLTALAKYMPAEVAVVVEDKRTIDMSDNDLLEIAKTSGTLIEHKAEELSH